MANNYKYQMTFDLNHRNEIIIEDVESINKTLNEETDLSQNGNTVFFGEEYKMGLNVIQEFVSVANKRKDKKNVNADLGGYFDSINNIVIFTGERGSGKTSAMLSFGEYLCNNDLKKQDLPNVRFWHLPMIDPSLFDENRNILLTLLSIMLEKAKQIQRNCDKTCVDENDSIYFDLLRQIQKVFEMVGHLNVKPDGKKYDLEYLNELGGVSSLKDEMRALVEKYLKFISPSADFLVLMVDDIDMNTEYAPQMLEQIQKFLMIDNLIILMAANMDQLQNEMTEHYSKSFSYTIKSGERKIAPMDVEDIATKYLLKIFPATSRIHLGNGASKLLQTSAKVIYSDGKIEGGENNGLQRFILNTIWQKTHLLFVPQNDKELHPIIPRNLRDLHQFVNLLLDLEDVERDSENVAKIFQTKKEYDAVARNFLKFKDYIMHTWIPYHLSYDQQMLFDKIPQEITEVNKYLIQIINTVANEYKRKRNITDAKKENITNYTFVSTEENNNYHIANEVSNLMNIPSNVSMGDLLLVIDKFSIYFEGNEENDFIEAVKVYYSMLLFETMFYSSDELDENDMVSAIQKLIGGTVYSPHYFKVVKCNLYSSISSDRFQEQLHYFTRDVKSTFKIGDVFLSLYYGSKRPKRISDVHIYDTINEWDKCRFDLLSLFSNALNPESTIMRYSHPEYFKYRYRKRVKAEIRELKDEKFIEDMRSDVTNWVESTMGSDVPLNDTSLIYPIYSLDMMMSLLKNTISMDVKNENEKEKEKEKEIEVFVSDPMKYLYEHTFDGFFEKCLDFNNRWSTSKERNKDLYERCKKVVSYSMKHEGKLGKTEQDSVEYNFYSICESVEKNVDFGKVFGEFISQCDPLSGEQLRNYLEHVAKCCEYYVSNRLNSVEIREFIISSKNKNDAICNIVNQLFIIPTLRRINEEVKQRIRSNDLVSQYYNNVGYIMLNSIKRVDLDGDSKVSNVFKSIYNAGVKVFIGEKAQIDYAEEKELGTEDTPASSVSGKE